MIDPRLAMMLSGLTKPDGDGNRHVIIGGNLHASYIATPLADIHYYPDEAPMITVQYSAPVVLVYTMPIDVGGNLAEWVKTGPCPLYEVQTHAAINGVVFHAGLMWKWNTLKPHILTGSATDLQYLQPGHEMAKLLLLHLTNTMWDEGYLGRL